MRGDNNEAANGGFGGAQDKHDGGEGGTGQGEERAADAHSGEREQGQNDLAKLVAIAADGEGVVQTATFLR